MKKRITLTVNDDTQSLLEALRGADVFLPAPCGGRGSCGKCRVKFLENVPEPSDQDLALLPKENLEAGERLACRAFVRGRISLEIEEAPEEPAAEESFTMSGDESRPDKVAVAVDLGTTTIAAGLVNAEAGRIVATRTCVNHQRDFGLDVLSRIDASNAGKGPVLQSLVRKDIRALCEDLIEDYESKILETPLVISGNTVMQHLLQGLSCEGLGTYPFTPVDLSLHRFENMTILPGISTYVGADAVSGVIACGMDRSEKISILVDLGTNGEMVIGNKKKMLAASAAAGPAFEGGNISCGLAAVPGAIDTVTIHGKKAEVTTIGDRPAVGLCGSGVLEMVYELLREGLVDETGLMAEEYFADGYPLAEGITFSAKDVREVQMAKSAIRSGIEILMEAYGVTCDDIDRLYLAGTFGRRINCRKAAGIGMIPVELLDRIIPVGNSSLMGAALYAMDEGRETADRYRHVVDVTEEILLADYGRFHDMYIENMSFLPLSNGGRIWKSKSD